LALSIEVIGLKKPITQLPITKTKKIVAIRVEMEKNLWVGATFFSAHP